MTLMKNCTYCEHGDEILTIFNYAIEHTTALYEYEPRTDAVIKAWFEGKTEQNYPVIGAFTQDGTLMGFATYGRFRPQPAFQYTVEHSVYLNPDYFGQGIAALLMEEIIRQAKEQGYHVMVGAIDAENSASIRLHEKLGFNAAGLITQSGYKFDRWLDLAFYQLLLTE